MRRLGINAGVVQWQYGCFPSNRHGFDSRYPLKYKKQLKSKNRAVMRGTIVIPEVYKILLSPRGIRQFFVLLR